MAAFFFESFVPFAFARATSSLANASLRTFTRGPFPERKTEDVSSADRTLCAEMFKPARVLPAPGTPVTKHMDLSPSFLEVSIISATQEEVTPRFQAPASDREMSSTVWP